MTTLYLTDMKQSVSPNNISWGANTSKREADQTMYRAMAFDIQRMRPASARKTIRVLSFPGPTWLWEQGLEEAFPSARFEFVGVEQDPRVWKRLAKMAAGLPGNYKMFPQATTFRSYVQSRRRNSTAFDVVYLDWMGTWSRDKKADLESMFADNTLAVGGVLVLTLSLRRGRPETMDELHDLSYDLPLAFYDARGEDKYVSSIKVRGIPHWVEAAAMDGYRIKLRPIMASVYYSHTGVGAKQTQPQLQLMFLREN